MKHNLAVLFLLSASSLGLLFLTGQLTGCSSSSSHAPVTESQTATLGTAVKNVQLSAQVPVEITFSYTIPGDISAYGDYSVDVTKTLENMTLSSAPVTNNTNRFETLWMLAKIIVKDALAAESADVTIHISFSGDPNVCTSPVVFGPYTITGAIGTVLSSNTKTIVPNQAATNIINAGSFDVCLITTPPVDAYFSLTNVDVNLEPCAAATVNIVDSWAGTYSCTNYGTSDDINLPISLHITPNANGGYHYDDDGGGSFDGHLCGNTFKFKGGISGSFEESGSFVFNGDTAVKTSRWSSIFNSTVGGSCNDDLHRI